MENLKQWMEQVDQTNPYAVIFLIVIIVFAGFFLYLAIDTLYNVNNNKIKKDPSKKAQSNKNQKKKK